MNFIKSLIPYRPWDFMDYFFMFLMGLIALFIGFVIFLFMAWICKLIFYESSYAATKTYNGEVVDMDYTPPRTTTSFNGKTTTTTHHPEKNIVIFKTDLKTTEVDSDKLYQRVRIGESVVVKSQDVYIKPRYWEGSWEPDGQRLISVTSEKGQTVNFNEEKPANYRRF